MRNLGVPEVLIDIVKSFYERMEAEIRVGDNMLDTIEVNNGLRQGCTMVPTLFNLYACVVCLEKVKNVEGAATHILYRLDKQLFRRSTKGACMECFRECQFADDVALLAITREAAETVTRLLSVCCTGF